MAVTADDLSTPLGQKSVRKRQFRLPITGTQAMVGVLGLVLITFLGFAIFNDNPLGGEPVTRVALRPAAAPPAEKSAQASGDARTAAETAKQPSAAGQKTVTIIDGSSGARHDVVLSGEASEKAETDTAAAAVAGTNPRLLEQSRYGMIPVVASWPPTRACSPASAKPPNAGSATSTMDPRPAASLQHWRRTSPCRSQRPIWRSIPFRPRWR